MFVYDTYEAGAIYGQDRYPLDDRVLGHWRRCYPDDPDFGDLMPPGMVSLVQQQAFSKVISPRPPGHIQGGQQFELFHLPARGDVLATTVQCVGKEIRRERRWVRIGFTARTEAGELVFTSVNTVLVPR